MIQTVEMEFISQAAGDSTSLSCNLSTVAIDAKMSQSALRLRSYQKLVMVAGVSANLEIASLSSGRSLSHDPSMLEYESTVRTLKNSHIGA